MSIEYRKKKESLLNLENVIRNLVAESIENYMENGTEDEREKSENSESSDEEGKKLKELKKNISKKNKDVTVNIRDEDQ